MQFRQKFKVRSGFFLAGMAALLLANLVHHFNRPESASWASSSDGVKGLCYGIAIGLLLLALRPVRAKC